MFDDAIYYVDNPLLALRWQTFLFDTWLRPGSFIEYYPLHECLLFLQWRMWGSDTFGYHATNVLLHIVNGLIIWRLFSQLRLRSAWLGGLLFVVHPMQVETVAWISEFKTLLSLLPLLLATSSYIVYERKASKRYYWFSVTLFITAMLCKIAVAPLPLVFLLYEWQKQGKFPKSKFYLLIPFLLVSLILGVISLRAGQIYANIEGLRTKAILPEGVIERITLISTSLLAYISHFLIPYRISFMYPQWAINPLETWQLLSTTALLGFLVYLILNVQRRNRLLLGMAFFVLFIALFCGVISCSYDDFTWVMDHLAYIPVVGLVAMIVIALDYATRHLPQSLQAYVTPAFLCLSMVLAIYSRSYAEDWSDPVRLCIRTISLYPHSWAARKHLAQELLAKGNSGQAITQLEAALAMEPDKADAHNNLGVALENDVNRASEAASEFREAIRIDPTYTAAYYNLAGLLANNPDNRAEAIILYKKALSLRTRAALTHFKLAALLAEDPDKVGDAIKEFEAVIRLRPNDRQVYLDLGSIVKLRPNFLTEVEPCFSQEINSNPGLAEAHFGFGLALEGAADRLQKAAAEFQAAIDLDPENAQWHREFGELLLRLPGRLNDAVKELSTVTELCPDSYEAHYNLARALSRDPARSQDALNEYHRSLSLNPRFAIGHYSLALLLADQGKTSAAIAEFELALKENPSLERAYYHIGVLLLRTEGRQNEALAHFQAALQINPDDVDVINQISILNSVQQLQLTNPSR